MVFKVGKYEDEVFWDVAPCSLVYVSQNKHFKTILDILLELRSILQILRHLFFAEPKTTSGIIGLIKPIISKFYTGIFNKNIYVGI